MSALRTVQLHSSREKLIVETGFVKMARIATTVLGTARVSRVESHLVDFAVLVALRLDLVSYLAPTAVVVEAQSAVSVKCSRLSKLLAAATRSAKETRPRCPVPAIVWTLPRQRPHRQRPHRQRSHRQPRLHHSVCFRATLVPMVASAALATVLARAVELASNSLLECGKDSITRTPLCHPSLSPCQDNFSQNDESIRNFA
mmetsp:Transcript_23163/g.44126  ORF Transcript_23163/g.44126 Transcript_23163/m.44126 type:complete len:201 (-) Transcript_23163:6-608(-)